MRCVELGIRRPARKSGGIASSSLRPGTRAVRRNAARGAPEPPDRCDRIGPPLERSTPLIAGQPAFVPVDDRQAQRDRSRSAAAPRWRSHRPWLGKSRLACTAWMNCSSSRQCPRARQTRAAARDDESRRPARRGGRRNCTWPLGAPGLCPRDRRVRSLRSLLPPAAAAQTTERTASGCIALADHFGRVRYRPAVPAAARAGTAHGWARQRAASTSSHVCGGRIRQNGSSAVAEKFHWASRRQRAIGRAQPDRTGQRPPGAPTVLAMSAA